jgi:hypothetical protein
VVVIGPALLQTHGGTAGATTPKDAAVDIVTLVNPHARARRNALRSLRAMQLRRAHTEEADRAVTAAADKQLEDSAAGTSPGTKPPA